MAGFGTEIVPSIRSNRPAGLWSQCDVLSVFKSNEGLGLGTKIMGKKIDLPESTPPRAAVPHGFCGIMWHRACPDPAKRDEGRPRLCLGALRCGVLALLAVSVAWAQAPEGIPRELARQRAQQISDLQYHLSLDVAAHAAAATGREELQFRLSAPGPVLLDFREGTVADLVVNGQPAA